MFKKIWNWLLGIEQDLESLTAPLATMVENLRDHVEAKVIEASDHARKSDLYAKLSADAHEAASEATKVADKIAGLISND